MIEPDTLHAKADKLIFFDVYQTLVDIDIGEERKKINEARGWAFVAISLERYGVHIASAELLAFIEKHRADLYAGKDKNIHHHNLCIIVLAVFREDLNVDISEQKVASLLFEYHKIARGHANLYPKVMETLAELKKRHTLAVASYTQGCYTQPELRELGIEKFFSDFFYTSDIGYRKTSPEFYKRCLEIAGKRAEDCVMVGDNYDTDILVPQKLGMKAIWIKNPATAFQYAHLLERRPENMIHLENFEKLLEVIPQTLLK